MAKKRPVGQSVAKNEIASTTNRFGMTRIREVTPKSTSPIRC